MTRPKASLSALGAAALWLAANTAAASGVSSPAQVVDEVSVKTIIVKADAGWVDTGMDVLQGQTLTIRAKGRITLQRGNPAADCGPEGLDLKTVQQPIPDRNVGALIGKVAQLISVRNDEDTGEEIRDEIIAVFHVGPESDILTSIRGRLYLGVNENTVKDNGGEFTVTIFRREAGRDGLAF